MKIVMASLISATCNVQENKDRILMLMRKYSGIADMVLFGEAFLQGFYSMDFQYERDVQIALPLEDAIIREIQEAAKANRIGVSFGLLERGNDKIYSTQLTISSQGDIADVFHRVSPGWKEPNADEHYVEGDRFHTFPYLGKIIAVGLCGDLWFEENVTEVKKLEPDILFWPVYTDFKAAEWNQTIKREYCAQASRMCRTVLYVNSVCLDQDGDEIAKGGNALFCDGKILQESPSGFESELLVEV